jgi:hypothetical protein
MNANATIKNINIKDTKFKKLEENEIKNIFNLDFDDCYTLYKSAKDILDEIQESEQEYFD